MDYRTRPPSEGLRPFVRALWRLRGRGDEIDPQPIMPDGSFEIVVHLGEPLVDQGDARRTHGRLRLAATLTRPVTVAAGGEVDAVGVRFRPGAAYPFLAVPPAEVVDSVVAAEGALGGDLVGAIGRLEPARTEELFIALEAALLARLARAGHDRRFDRVAGWLASRGGGGSVSALANAAGTSVRQLERWFEARVGVPPKVLQRVLRFHRAVGELLRQEDDLAGVALGAGYCDQGHMTREFRAISQTTPGRYARAPGLLDRFFADA